MNKTSENKMHVWGFLKACLSETVQSELPLDYGFPVNRKARGRLATTAEKQGVNRISIDELNEIIDTCHISLADPHVYSIIEQELDQLIAGQLSPKETAVEIQSKVETFLMEQGGSVNRGYTFIFITLTTVIVFVAIFLLIKHRRKSR